MMRPFGGEQFGQRPADEAHYRRPAESGPARRWQTHPGVSDDELDRLLGLYEGTQPENEGNADMRAEKLRELRRTESDLWRARHELRRMDAMLSANPQTRLPIARSSLTARIYGLERRVRMLEDGLGMQRSFDPSL